MTPTQLREAHQLLMDDAKSIIDNHDSISARNFARGAIAVTSYQQERIAELEQKLATAENFAGCAKAELERVQERLAASENARLEAQSIAQTYRAWAQHRAAQEIRKAYQRGKRDAQHPNP